MKTLHRFIVLAGFSLVLAIILIKLSGADQNGPMKRHDGVHRVLPTNTDQVDLLSLLIEPTDLVAIPEQALSYSRVVSGDPLYRKLPTFNRFVAETALKWQTTLVLVSPFVSDDTQSQLRRLGCNVVNLPSRSNMKDVFAAVTLLGHDLGMEARAEQALRRLRRRMDRLERRVKNDRAIAGRSRVLSYVNYGTGGWGAGEGSSIDHVMELAGLVNAARRLKRPGAFNMSFEDLIRLDPDYIVVGDVGVGEAGTTEKLLCSNEATAQLRAVREKNFLRLPRTLISASSQEMLTAAEVLHDLWVTAERKKRP